MRLHIWWFMHSVSTKTDGDFHMIDHMVYKLHQKFRAIGNTKLSLPGFPVRSPLVQGMRAQSVGKICTVINDLTRQEIERTLDSRVDNTYACVQFFCLYKF